MEKAGKFEHSLPRAMEAGNSMESLELDYSKFQQKFCEYLCLTSSQTIMFSVEIINSLQNTLLSKMLFSTELIIFNGKKSVYLCTSTFIFSTECTDSLYTKPRLSILAYCTL